MSIGEPRLPQILEISTEVISDNDAGDLISSQELQAKVLDGKSEREEIQPIESRKDFKMEVKSLQKSVEIDKSPERDIKKSPLGPTPI